MLNSEMTSEDTEISKRETWNQVVRDLQSSPSRGLSENVKGPAGHEKLGTWETRQKVLNNS